MGHTIEKLLKNNTRISAEGTRGGARARSDPPTPHPPPPPPTHHTHTPPAALVLLRSRQRRTRRGARHPAGWWHGLAGRQALPQRHCVRRLRCPAQRRFADKGDSPSSSPFPGGAHPRPAHRRRHDWCVCACVRGMRGCRVRRHKAETRKRHKDVDARPHRRLHLPPPT